MTGRVRARLTLIVEKQATLPSQTYSEILQESRDVRRGFGAPQRFTDRPFRGFTCHEPEGHGLMGPFGPSRVFAEPRLEKRGAVDRFHERLDDAAHARCHSAGKHAERDLAPSDRLEANRRKPFVARGTRGWRIGQVHLTGKLDEPGHAIALFRQQTGLTASP